MPSTGSKVRKKTPSSPSSSSSNVAADNRFLLLPPGLESDEFDSPPGPCPSSSPPAAGWSMVVMSSRCRLLLLFCCCLLALPSHGTQSPLSPSSCALPLLAIAVVVFGDSRNRRNTQELSTVLSVCNDVRLGPLAVQAFVGTYGVNYGRIADNIPPPESVVTLLKAAKIRNVKIYDADHSVLDAFKGSGLNLVIAIPNGLLKDMAANENKAMDWLNENVQPYLPQTRIVGITVGNEVLGGQDQELAEALFGAVKNVYNGLKRLNLADRIELSTPHSEAVFGTSYPPSACVFKEDVMVYMKPLLDFFSKIGSPFYVNAYPFLAYLSDPEHIDINYALFKPNSGIYDEKTNLRYDNMFDAQIDAAYAALEVAGYKDMEVRVAETGWASSGDPNEAGATVENARTYNFNLRKRLFLRKGTPRRPKTPVKAYIFALFNENLKPGPSSERHYGLFNADGSISYNIGFTGLKPSSASSSLLSFKKIRAEGWIVHYLATLLSCIFIVLALAT